MLDLMRLFTQVVGEQSFTAVARIMGISQPAVSNQIRSFEEKLGVKLLTRKGKGFVLTPEGEIVYKYSLHILNKWSELMHEIKNSDKLMGGKIHIGASHIPGEYLLPGYLASFRKIYPGIVFKLSIGDSLEMAEKVLSNEVDFAVVGAVFDTEKLTSELWRKDELGLVISDSHSLSTCNSIELRSIIKEPMIIRKNGSGHRRAFEEAISKQGLSLTNFNVVLEVGSTEAVKNAVRSDMGFSILSKYAAESFEKQGLVWKKVKDISLRRSFYLLTRRNKSLSAIADVCYGYLATQGTEVREKKG